MWLQLTVSLLLVLLLTIDSGVKISLRLFMSLDYSRVLTAHSILITIFLCVDILRCRYVCVDILGCRYSWCVRHGGHRATVPWS